MMDKYRNTEKQAAPAPASPQEKEDNRIRVNGFAQVLEMLRIADDDFRESLLRRLAGRDRKLAAALRQELENL